MLLSEIKEGNELLGEIKGKWVKWVKTQGLSNSRVKGDWHKETIWLPISWCKESTWIKRKVWLKHDFSKVQNLLKDKWRIGNGFRSKMSAKRWFGGKS
jgi:hypothetical protein